MEFSIVCWEDPEFQVHHMELFSFEQNVAFTGKIKPTFLQTFNLNVFHLWRSPSRQRRYIDVGGSEIVYDMNK
jgi:hypothetical protein